MKKPYQNDAAPGPKIILIRLDATDIKDLEKIRHKLNIATRNKTIQRIITLAKNYLTIRDEIQNLYETKEVINEEKLNHLQVSIKHLN